jgi:hypothetical protein
MSLGEIIFYLAIIIIAFVGFVKLFKPSKAVKDSERELKKRLSDDLLYDPVSGAKFTLDQAENGTWVTHDNHSRIKSEEEINTYFDGSGRTVEQIANLLKSRNFKITEIKEDTLQVLENSETLLKYDDWGYGQAFKIDDNAVVLFPHVFVYGRGKGTVTFNGHQLMFAIKVTGATGHYFLRKKETSERILDLIRNDDAFEVGDFEVFTIRPGHSNLQVQRVLRYFGQLDNIELEINGENLLIKTTNEPSKTQFETLLKTVQSR